MNLLIDTFLNILKEGFFFFFSDAMNNYSLKQPFVTQKRDCFCFALKVPWRSLTVHFLLTDIPVFDASSGADLLGGCLRYTRTSRSRRVCSGDR